MDIAKTFKPRNILLWSKIADHPDAIRILRMFPNANVEVIEHQRIGPMPNISMAQAIKSGKRTLMIGRTQSFVGNFNGCLGKTVRCCPYHKLIPISNGCPYYCTYCYLAFIYRKYAPYIKININYNTMFKQIRKILVNTSGRCNFNMGEMLDSLALDHITNLTSILVPFFSDFPNGFLMLLTKSSNIENLLSVKANNQVVVSWSINSREIIEIHEKGTANLTERINATRKCQQYGYRIRFRIDPGIIYTNWKIGYAELIKQALTQTEPENITLGMLRLLPGHIRLFNNANFSCADMFTDKILQDSASDGKLRFLTDLRIEFYKFLINTIRSFNRDVSIGLCRETPQVWHALKSMVEPDKCNCVTW